MPAPQPIPVLLDTDIGSDVDDILALAFLANSPELDLVGVTTVYGDTMLRARMVRYVLDRLDRADIPVGIGARETLSGRPVWWAGHEGASIPDLERVVVDDSLSALELLRRAAIEHHGNLHLIAIGPLTNIAQAILADVDFAPALDQITIMGGAFWPPQAEHNITCDPAAADIVVRSGIPLTFIGLDVTRRVLLREADMPRIAAAPAVGPLLEAEVRRWWAFRDATENQLHDPLAVLSLIRPDLFQFKQCDIRIDLVGPDAGRTHPERCSDGPFRIASEVDPRTAEQTIVRRIVGEGESLRSGGEGGKDDESRSRGVAKSSETDSQ